MARSVKSNGLRVVRFSTPSVVSQKSIYIFNALALAKIKSPVSRFSKGEMSPRRTPLSPKGKGRFACALQMESPRKHRRIICQELLGTVH